MLTAFRSRRLRDIYDVQAGVWATVFDQTPSKSLFAIFLGLEP